MRAIATILLLVCSGCATIMSGTTQPIHLYSSPNEARVYMRKCLTAKTDAVYAKRWPSQIEARDSIKTGPETFVVTTPGVIILSRKYSVILRFEKEGYYATEILIERKMDPWFWGNCLFGGLFGMVIDADTGASKKLKPNNVQVTLKPIE